MDTTLMVRIINRSGLIALCVAALAAGTLSLPAANTRWPALQFMPNADMPAAGRFTVDADFLWAVDTFDIAKPILTQRVHAGLSEWVSIDVGYAEGLTMGFKANIIKEAGDSYIPTVTLGMQNLFNSRNTLGFTGGSGAPPKNEAYFAAAKNLETAKARIHAGILSALSYDSGKDRFSPFVGFEKYFGHGLYMTAEVQRYGGEFLLAFFTVYRPLADKLEVNLGVIDAVGASRYKPSGARLARPLARAGLKVYIGSGYKTFEGLTGVEDRIDRHRDTIAALSGRVDTLNSELRWAAQRIHALSGYSEGPREERARVVEELTMLRNLYDQEPFDPGLVRNAAERINDRRDTVLPHLRVIITDPQVPIRIRALAVSLIGDMGDKLSSDILISMLSRFEEPSLKTEIIVALGKMKETRAQAALKALRSDPDSGVAFTAAEIYKSLFGEDEAPETPETPEALPEDKDNTVPERRINVR